MKKSGLNNHVATAAEARHKSDHHGSSSQSPTFPCRSDMDCHPLIALNSKHWRCMISTGDAPTPANNCHVPGPGMVGNSTCRCSVEECRPTVPPNHTNHTNGRIQYLMIGDSISLGMVAPLRNILTLKGWELTHSTGNANSVNYGLHCLEDMLNNNGDGNSSSSSWDVISFNFGLHGLAHDTEWLSDEQYRVLLRRVVSRLLELQSTTGVRLIWVNTTPVPTVPVYDENTSCNETSKCLNPPRYNHDVVRRNQIAADILDTINTSRGDVNQIETIDLYNYVLSQCGSKSNYTKCDGFQLPSNVHYTKQGWDLMASFMAGALLSGKDDEKDPLLLGEESSAVI